MRTTHEESVLWWTRCTWFWLDMKLFIVRMVKHYTQQMWQSNWLTGCFPFRFAQRSLQSTKHSIRPGSEPDLDPDLAVTTPTTGGLTLDLPQYSSAWLYSPLASEVWWPFPSHGNGWNTFIQSSPQTSEYEKFHHTRVLRTYWLLRASPPEPSSSSWGYDDAPSSPSPGRTPRTAASTPDACYNAWPCWQDHRRRISSWS